MRIDSIVDVHFACCRGQRLHDDMIENCELDMSTMFDLRQSGVAHALEEAVCLKVGKCLSVAEVLPVGESASHPLSCETASNDQSTQTKRCEQSVSASREST